MKNIKNLIVLAIFVIFINGCAKTDPVDSVIEHHHNHITDVLDYAKNNIEQTKDVVFLENELKGCDIALADVKQVYLGQISTCRAETRYWKLATGSMFLIVVGLIIAIIKRWFK